MVAREIILLPYYFSSSFNYPIVLKFWLLRISSRIILRINFFLSDKLGIFNYCQLTIWIIFSNDFLKSKTLQIIFSTVKLAVTDFFIYFFFTCFLLFSIRLCWVDFLFLLLLSFVHLFTLIFLPVNIPLKKSRRRLEDHYHYYILLPETRMALYSLIFTS